MEDSRVEHVERVEELKALAAEVGQVAYSVHEYFGVGLLEKVYETALEHRLEKLGFKVERQKPLNVFDEDGYCVGEYFVDLLINDKLIVELKAAKSLAPEHLAQVLNYMKITRQPVALLINFGSYKFERRTVINSQPPLSTRSTCSTRLNSPPSSQPPLSTRSTCSTRLNPNQELYHDYRH